MHRYAALVLALVFPLFVPAATFTVDDTGDAPDANVGNGACATAGGVCTLRAALQEANAAAAIDTIQFGIGSGPQTITPGTALPISTDVIVDGTTQPGSGAGPFILIDGQNLVTVGFDFAIASGLDVTIQGLAIGRFTQAGIKTYQSGGGVTIKRCHIGVGLDGLTAMPNGDGIIARINTFGGSSLVLGDASGGGNVISGNADMAVEITDTGVGAKLATLTLQGNTIGLGSDGMTAVPNLSGGIRVNIQFGAITIGGSVAGRNVISGNGGSGYITSGFLQADSILVSHNYIGVAQDGITARGNNGSGAILVGKQYTVESNIVASNSANGLFFTTCSLTSPIRGNRIGIALDGSPRGNGGSGIHWDFQSGGLIGGPGADQNIVAYNAGAGIRIEDGSAEIDANSIFENGQLGIDIGTTNVVDANDANDVDTGFGNNLQNRPAILTAVRSGGATYVTGSVASAPSTAYWIRVFSSTTADPSGFGEGETFLGEVSVTTNASGNAGFNFTTAGAPAGSFVTATATSAGGDTSEFSNALIVSIPPQFRFTAPTHSTGESGNVAVSIERTGDPSGGASVGWSTMAGSASGTDFTGGSGTAIFVPGQIVHVLNIPIAPDTIDEGLESFNVTLSAPSAGYEVGTPAVTTVDITDDDPPPSISIAGTSTNEGNAGNTPLTFNVTLSAASGQTIAIDYTTSNGTAAAGSDYAAAAGMLTFAAGETSKTIVVQLTGDSAIELDETFTVTLSNPSNVTLGTNVATGTIVNDDGAPSITIDDVAIVEGDSGTSTALFTLTLSGPTASTVTVGWSTSDGAATAGDDYEPGSGTATFAPGDLTAAIAVTINGDVLIEDNETFFVDLAGPANATLADAQGGGTIADDDGTPSLSINDPAVVEGVTATFTVTLAPASALPVTVAYATSNGTADDASDYAAATNTLTFAPGETSKPIDIATTSDAIAEAVEQFAVTLSSPSGATIGDANATATIIDDDGAPRVTIGNASSPEGGGGTLTFTIDLSHASASPIDVTWSTADDTATAGSDYTSAGATITFAPGETSKSVDVTISDDALVEPDETFFVQLTGATNATITGDEGVGTIANDDGAVTVSIANVTANEGTGGATTFTFDVTLNVASADTITVPWATADDTAIAGSDYTAGSGNLVFPSGDTLESIAITVIPDSTFEANETFFVNLLAATNATFADDQATGTIVNDDPAPAVPSVSVAPASVTEGNAGTASLVFAVTLDVPTINTVTVDYTTGGGAATAGADYVAANGTLTFAPGVTSQNVTIAVIGDTLVEGNETFALTLSAPSNATLGTATANGTIVDDDVAPAVPSISIAPASAVEGNAGSASLTFAVTLNVPTLATVTVDYATSAVTATDGTDYASTSGTLTFAPGELTQNIVVPVVGDTLVEGTETLLVTLTAPTNATLNTATANGTILDDDSAPAVPSISIAPASAAEGNIGSTPFTFAVTLNVPTVATVTVDYATSAGTATAATDYATTIGTLTFAPGVTTQNVIVPVIGDTIVEGSETFVVTLTAPTNATLGTANATGTILDDDTAPVVPAISIGDVTLIEGDTGATLFAFPVTLTVASTLPVSVAWTTVSGSATTSADFIAASGTVVFAAGMTTQTIPIAVHGDEDVESDEAFTIQLTAPVNATLADAIGAGTIRNDDRSAPSTPSLQAASVIVNEGAGEAIVTLTLSSRAQNGASIRWMTRGGTATGASDFIEASGRVTFGSNTTATIAIAILNDMLDEPNESFVVELFDADGLTLRDPRTEIAIVDDDETAPQRAIVMAVGSLRGNAGARFGTAVQMVNLTDAPAEGSLVIRPAGTNDPSRDATLPYALGPRQLRAWTDLLAENGLEGLATLDVIATTGATPHMTVRIYDDGTGRGTTGFTLPVVTPSDALLAGDTGLLVAPDDPIAMRFNIGIRTLDAGATLTITIRDRTGATRHTMTREFEPNWFNQMPAADFAAVAPRSGDYIAVHVTHGSAILYGAAVDNETNDPSVQVVTK